MWGRAELRRAVRSGLRSGQAGIRDVGEGMLASRREGGGEWRGREARASSWGSERGAAKGRELVAVMVVRGAGRTRNGHGQGGSDPRVARGDRPPTRSEGNLHVSAFCSPLAACASDLIQKSKKPHSPRRRLFRTAMYTTAIAPSAPARRRARIPRDQVTCR